MPIGLEQWRAQIGALEAQRYRYLSRAARKAARGGRSRVCRVSGRGTRCWVGFAVGVTLLVLVVSFSLLLLRAGDVERNPGPLTITSRLEVGDLVTVQDELVNLSSKWRDIGLGLGFHPGILDEIQLQKSDPSPCLQEMLERWLKTVNPPPTWEGLAKALERPTVGEYQKAQQLRDKSAGVMVSGKKTLEYRTISKQFSTIVDALSTSVDPASLAQKLFEAGVITESVVEKANVTGGTTPSQRIYPIVQAVRTHVDLKASKYHDFIAVLQDTCPTLAKVLQKLFTTDLELNAPTVLSEVTDWEALGRHLNVNPWKLKEIQKTGTNPQHCKEELMKEWVKTDPGASWQKLSRSLDEMGEQEAAERVKGTYINVSGQGSMAASKKTHEYHTISKHFSIIVAALSAVVDPASFAQKLHEADVITASILGASVTGGPTPTERIGSIIRAVQTHVCLKASKYHDFITVLQDTCPTLAEMLQKFFKTDLEMNAPSVLSEVSDWKSLGNNLGVNPGKLNELEQSGGDLQHCKEEMLKEWIETDPRASWRKLFRVLDQMGEDVAERVKDSYMEVSSQDAVPDEHSEQQKDDVEILREIKSLGSRFEDLSFAIQKEMEKDRVSPERFRHSLTLLPESIRPNHIQFLRGNLSDMSSAGSIEELFMHLNLYWDLFDYTLLEYIIERFGSDELKKRMNKYMHDLAQFRRTTTLGQLIKYRPGRAEPPPNFSEVKVHLTKNPMEYTLEEVEQLRRNICIEYRFKPFVLMFAKLEWNKELGEDDSLDDALANKLFEEAMKLGKVDAQIAKCIFMGAAGAGKTNVIHLLLDLDPPPIRTSTDAVTKSRRVTCIKFATPSITKPDEDPEIGEEDPDIWREITGEEMRRLLADAISIVTTDVPEGAGRESDTESTPGSSSPTPEFEEDIVKAKLKSSDTTPDEPKLASPDSMSAVKEDIVNPKPASPESKSKVKADIIKLVGKVHEGGKLLKMKWMYIVDSGGQNEFLDILPAFIKNTSACVFVLKLSEDLEHYPDIEYHDESGKRGSYVSHLSNKDIFQSCMQTIQSLPCSDDCGTFPEVIIVGTHTDEEGEHQKVKRDAKNKQLCDILLPTPESSDDHIIFNRLHRKEVVFPVNATSRDPKDKAVAAKLLKQIKFSPQPLPLQWYGLELEIESMAEDVGRGIISWKECEEAAHKMHFPGSIDHPDSHQIEFHKSLDAALKYLDKLNIILYYPKVLPNLVFAHPSVLLEKVSELVKKSFELRGERPTESCDPTAGEWSPFCDKGIITIKFLETFKSHYAKDLFEPHHLIELLDSLLITAKVSDTEHFMPCLLAKFPPDKLNSKDSDNGHATPFAVYFSKGHAPCGLFPAVVAYLCSSKNKMGAWRQASHKLYRNHMTFRTSQSFVKVTLNDSLSFFEVHVLINGPSYLYKKHCPTIREAVWAGIKYAIGVRSFRGVDYEEAFLVCQCSAKSHPATVQYEDTPYWTCTKSEKWDNLKEKQMVWYEQGVVNSLKQLHPQGPDVQQPPPPKRHAVDTRYGSSSIHQPLPVGGYQQTSGPDVQQPPPPKRPAIHTQYASVHQPPPVGGYQQTPGHPSSSVSDEQTLEPEHLPCVIKAVSMLSGRWKNIHTCLRITSRTCDDISKVHPRNPMRCLITVIDEWLNLNYDMKRDPGDPTWRKVVWFVRDKIGGDNAVQASFIENNIADLSVFKPGHMAEKANSAPLPVDKGEDALKALVTDVTTLLGEVGAKWFEIGVLLGVPVCTLEEFSQSEDVHDSNLCLQKIVRVWLNANVSEPERRTWQILADAMEHPVGGSNRRIARQIVKHSNSQEPAPQV